MPRLARRTARLVGVAVLTILAFGGLVSCSLGRQVAPSPHPSRSVPVLGNSLGATPGPTASPGAPVVVGTAPGDSSPAAAVAGFLDAVVGPHAARACAYVVPSQQAACPGVVVPLNVTVEGGPIRIGDTYLVGNQALVVPLGTICVGQCSTNTNPRLGLPANDAGFADAYRIATDTAILTNPCQQVNGKWYVFLGNLPTPSPI